MRPDTRVEIGGVPYTVRFSIGAMIRIEDELGFPITTLKKRYGANVPMGTLATFVKHGLRIEGRPITEKEFGVLMDSLSPEEFTAAATVILGSLSEPPGKGETGTKN